MTGPGEHALYDTRLLVTGWDCTPRTGVHSAACELIKRERSSQVGQIAFPQGLPQVFLFGGRPSICGGSTFPWNDFLLRPQGESVVANLSPSSRRTNHSVPGTVSGCFTASPVYSS